MRLGVVLPTFTTDITRPMVAASHAAEVGADAVFAVDHLFPPGAPDRPGLEPFSLLAAVAARHPMLGAGVLVARAGMRPEGLVAAQAAALALQTEGRFVLGIGAGDALVRAEHETFGLPFPPAAERIARAEETARAIVALRDGEVWTGGEHVPAIAGPIGPGARPVVWLGGLARSIVEAAGRSADGWNGWGVDAEGFTTRAELVRAAAAQAGRTPDEVAPTWGGIVLVGRDEDELRRLDAERAATGVAWDPWRGTIEDLRRHLAALRAAGATWFIVTPAGPGDRLAIIASTLREG